MTSAWVSGPERGLGKMPEKEDKPVPEECSFYPDLVSDDVLRDTVPSSGYGSSVPPPKEVKQVVDPELVFEPQLPGADTAAGRLRAVAPSSGYGIDVVPKPKHQKKPLPGDFFKPQITQTKLARRMRKEAPSSGYGRALIRPKQPKAPPPFKPIQIKFSGSSKGDALRKQAPSSKYGKNLPQTPEWKLAAMKADKMDKSATMKRQSTHTLLDPDAQQDDAEPEPEYDDGRPPFVLDGHLLENQINPRINGLSLKYQQKWIPDRVLPPSKMKDQYDSSVNSQGYGRDWHPPVDESKIPVERDEREAGFQVTRATPIEKLFDQVAADEDELHVSGELRPSQKKMAHVPSSNYGVDFPEVVERHDPEPVKAWVPPSNKTGDLIPPPPPTPRNDKLNNSVGSHGYGTVSPHKGKRKPVEFAPVWVPSSNTPDIPDPGPAPPRKEIPAGSHYRKEEYFP